jgi:hypothetical protein
LRTDVSEDQVLFEIHGLILALHYETRLLHSPGAIARAEAGFERILGHFLVDRPADPVR